jgi:hypothetical protein
LCLLYRVRDLGRVVFFFLFVGVDDPCC